MSAPREVIDALDALNHLHAEATWAGHILGAYLSEPEPSAEQHKRVREAAAGTNVAGRNVVTKFEGVIKLMRAQEKARAKS